MKRNSSRIWGRKTRTEEMPFHAPSRTSDCSQPAGSSGRTKSPMLGEDVAEAVGERLADGEDHFEDADNDDEEEQRSPDAMEQNVVDLAAVFSRKRSAVAGAAADLRGPGVRAGGVAEHGQRERLLCGRAVAGLIEEERNGVQAGAVGGADGRDGSAELLGQFERVDVAAAGFHQVAHVEQDEGGQAEREHGRGEHELAGEVQRIENQQNGVGLGRAGHFAAEHVDGDAGVFGVGRERVDAGQVDEGEVVAADAGHEAHALLDGDAGIVGDLLAQAGEAIEERGLAGVGRSDEDNGVE